MRAAIFDFDGVLVDSEPLHFHTLRETLLTQGVAIDQQEYAEHYLAYDDRGALRLALSAHGRNPEPGLIDELAEHKARLFEKLLPGIPFFPGARELLRALAAEVPVGIASGALHAEIDIALRAGEVRDSVSVVVGVDDVVQTKPHPEPYLTAVARLGLADASPGDCVAFEDSLAGVASARAAGLKVVAVTNSFPAARLQAAHRVVDSLAGLPLASLRELF
jgi:beta-phosphoglucomutase